MMEALLVANDFDCDILIGFVVEGPNDLSEAALANYLQDFVAIANVIMNNLTKIRKVLINVSEFYIWLLRQTQHTTRQLCLRISIVMMMFIHDPSSLCERNFTTTTSRPESKVLQWRHNEAFPVSTISEALRVQNPLPRTDDKSWCQWLTVGMPREMCLLRVTWEMKLSEISLDNGGEEKKELRIVTCLLVISCHKLSSDSHDGIAFFASKQKWHVNVICERLLSGFSSAAFWDESSTLPWGFGVLPQVAKTLFVSCMFLLFHYLCFSLLFLCFMARSGAGWEEAIKCIRGKLMFAFCHFFLSPRAFKRKLFTSVNIMRWACTVPSCS